MKRISQAAFWIPVLLLVIVRVHNACTYVPHFGYDNYAHVRYLQAVVNGIYPMPSENEAANHPPGYYEITAGVARLCGTTQGEALLKTAQAVSTAASILTILAAYLLSRLYAPGAAWFAAAAIAALPIDLILAPMVYNASLTALLAAAFLGLYSVAWRRPQPRLIEEAGLGLLAGLALRVRLDAAILIILIALLWAGRMWRNPRGWRDFALSAALATMIATNFVAGFFLRNLASYGRPFVFAFDPDILPFPEPGNPHLLPGFHSPSFYLAWDGDVFTNPAFPAAYPSFWLSTYATAWWDYFHYFFFAWDLRWGRAMLVAGVLPSSLFVLGLWRSTRELEQTWPLLSTILACGVFYAAISAVSPTYTQVKANHLDTAFVAYAVCTALGCACVAPRHHWRKAGLTAYFCALCLLVCWTFWLPTVPG